MAAPGWSASATSLPDDTRDDSALVAASRAGDATALDTLLRRHAGRLGPLCVRMLGNVHDGSDALQEAMVQIVRKLDRFDGRSAFGTWAYRLTANVCLDELRRRKRRPSPTEMEFDEPRADFASTSIDRQVIEEALEHLPDDYRSAVVLRDLCGYEYADIAEMVGVPIGTVRSRIARGRGMLAGIIGNPEGGADRPTT